MENVIGLVIAAAMLMMFWGVLKRALGSIEQVSNTVLKATDTAVNIADEKVSIFEQSQSIADQTEMSRIADELKALDNWYEVEDLETLKAELRANRNKKTAKK